MGDVDPLFVATPKSSPPPLLTAQILLVLLLRPNLMKRQMTRNHRLKKK